MIPAALLRPHQIRRIPIIISCLQIRLWHQPCLPERRATHQAPPGLPAAAEDLAEGGPVAVRHDVVEEGIQRGLEVVEDAGGEEDQVGGVLEVVGAVDGEEALRVEGRPADEETQHYSSCKWKKLWVFSLFCTVILEHFSKI